jgi:hypothetical protein
LEQTVEVDAGGADPVVVDLDGLLADARPGDNGEVPKTACSSGVQQVAPSAAVVASSA